MTPVEFARAVLADESAVILDTETTGLDGAFVVEIAIMGIDGEELLNTRVNPQIPIPKGATRCHGITDEMVAGCPTFAQILPRIEDAVRGRRVLIYNAEYDMGVLRNELRRAGLDVKEWGKIARWKDVMMPYSEWVGERWPEWSYHAGQVKWQKLPGGDHSAMGDCRATLAVLQKMAKSQ